MEPTKKRMKRLVIPLGVDEAELVKDAARVVGLKPTTFARRTLLRRAAIALERQQPKPRMLRREAWEHFCQALEGRPVANAALQRAVQRSGEDNARQIVPESPASSGPGRRVGHG